MLQPMAPIPVILRSVAVQPAAGSSRMSPIIRNWSQIKPIRWPASMVRHRSISSTVRRRTTFSQTSAHLCRLWLTNTASTTDRLTQPASAAATMHPCEPTIRHCSGPTPTTVFPETMPAAMARYRRTLAIYQAATGRNADNYTYIGNHAYCPLPFGRLPNNQVPNCKPACPLPLFATPADNTDTIHGQNIDGLQSSSRHRCHVSMPVARSDDAVSLRHQQLDRGVAGLRALSYGRNWVLALSERRVSARPEMQIGVGLSERMGINITVCKRACGWSVSAQCGFRPAGS